MQTARELIEDSPGALVLLRLVHENQLDGEIKSAVLTKAAAHADANVRALYEQFIPPEERPRRLGAAVSANEFAFLDHLWRDWSPGWDYPDEVMRSVKATMGTPGVLKAALSYYRSLFDSSDFHPGLAGIQSTLFTTPITVPTLYFHGQHDGCIGVELVDDMDPYFAGGLEKVILPVGHFVQQEAPDEVNRHLLRVLES